ncbi:adenylate/guanylate cyclase domain-containing protein [Ruegeria sp. 2205SS24-7]|uniref:ATP-binding protein n=1 Tax=Ruegeria discodermiae TaxID=3064389 RepID=UPI002741F42C|nr:adenylate/guanylate cyclase domain-containing protein [Ruegeria sp. 2205SS24-7]MDP5216971.1 adenylate/guanylate cyclase domain-containing protein [Ruegeria sp. 2205SS24-7]
MDSKIDLFACRFISKVTSNPWGGDGETAFFVGSRKMNRSRHQLNNSISETNQSSLKPATSAAEAISTDVQRRQATVVFADIANSTALCEEIGTENYYVILKQVMTILVDEVQAQGGAVTEYAGDGVMALFGAPSPLEDSALRACKAAVRIHDAISHLSSETDRQRKTSVQLRIGINSGTIVGGRLGIINTHDFTALGDTVNLAARLEKLASPGSTLLSDSVFSEVEPHIIAEAIGEHSLKGFQAPEMVFRLIASRPGVSRFDAAIFKGLTTFTARQGIVDSLMESFSRSESGLQVELISGEPGIGKSRLLHEFIRQLDLHNGRVKVFEAHCTWDGQQIPFRPVIDFIRSGFHLTDSETVSSSEQKLRKGLEALGLPTGNNLHLLLNVLGIVPWKGDLHNRHVEVVGNLTRNLMIDILRSRCALCPVVFQIEDLQWIDSASEELLTHVIDSCCDLPMLVVGTFRPEYEPHRIAHDLVTKRVLQPLNSTEMSQLLRAILNGISPPEELRFFVEGEADGNPLFAEEIVQYLMNSEALIATQQGYTFEKRFLELSPPASIQNLVLARIDNLTEPAAKLLQAASVLGRTFSMELLSGLSGETATSGRPIEELLKSNLLIADKSAGPDILKFRHALVRDAVYDTLLISKRQELHAKAAFELIARWEGRENEIVETLVYHFERTEHKRDLFHYLHMAASKCLRIYSLDDARRYFQQTLTLYDEFPGTIDQRSLAALLADAMREIQLRSDFRAIVKLAKRYWPQIEEMPSSQEKSLVLMNYGHALSHAHNFALAEAVTLEGIGIAQELGDLETEAYGKVVLMKTYNKNISGQPPDIVQKIGADVMSVAQNNADGYLESVAIFEIASSYMHRGQIDKARKHAAELYAVGQRKDDPRIEAFSSWLHGWLDIQEERFQQAMDHADNCKRSALTTADRLVGKMVEGSARTLSGDPNEGRKILQNIHDKATKLGDKNMLSGVEPMLGVAIVLTGDLTAGMRWLKACAAERDRVGYKGGSYFTKLVMAEVYMRLYLRQGQLPIGKIIRNLPYIVFVIPSAGRRAEQLFREVEKSGQYDYPSITHVRVNLGLGLIHQKRKHIEKAREYLNEARLVAKELNATALLNKTEEAIASLEAKHAIE